MWKVNGSFHLLHVLMTILGLSRIPDIERCHKLLTNTDFGGSTCFQGITLYQTLIFSELQLVCHNQGQMLIGKAVTVRVKRGLCLNNFVEKKRLCSQRIVLLGTKKKRHRHLRSSSGAFGWKSSVRQPKLQVRYLEIEQEPTVNNDFLGFGMFWSNAFQTKSSHVLRRLKFSSTKLPI